MAYVPAEKAEMVGMGSYGAYGAYGAYGQDTPAVPSASIRRKGVLDELERSVESFLTPESEGVPWIHYLFAAGVGYAAGKYLFK